MVVTAASMALETEGLLASKFLPDPSGLLTLVMVAFHA